MLTSVAHQNQRACANRSQPVLLLWTIASQEQEVTFPLSLSHLTTQSHLSVEWMCLPEYVHSCCCVTHEPGAAGVLSAVIWASY